MLLAERLCVSPNKPGVGTIAGPRGRPGTHECARHNGFDTLAGFTKLSGRARSVNDARRGATGLIARGIL